MTVKITSLLIVLTVALTGCLSNQMLRHEKARRIAGPAFMIDRDIQTEFFSLRLFERVHDRGGIAHVYIEGDDVYTGIDPTPDTPIGLQLAARDKAENVIYISRPCQFNGRNHVYKETPHEAEGCNLSYTTTDRFSADVIAGYHEALDNLKRYWGIQGFHIYGHSGGGTIGALLASERKDILSLTTIAGNLDHEAYSHSVHQKKNSKHQPLTGSLNAKNIAVTLKHLPQYHYSGSADTVMPPAVLHSYLNALGPTNCVQYKVIQENGYTEGWVDKWPALLKDKPQCQGAVKHVIE